MNELKKEGESGSLDCVDDKGPIRLSTGKADRSLIPDDGENLNGTAAANSFIEDLARRFEKLHKIRLINETVDRTYTIVSGKPNLETLIKCVSEFQRYDGSPLLTMQFQAEKYGEWEHCVEIFFHSIWMNDVCNLINYLKEKKEVGKR